MSETALLVVLTVAAVAAGIALGRPLARWQMRNAGRASQAVWAVVGAFGTAALLRAVGYLAIPLGALVLTAAAASVIAIRRELRRQGRI